MTISNRLKFLDSRFNESEHPRKSNGQFGSGSGEKSEKSTSKNNSSKKDSKKLDDAFVKADRELDGAVEKYTDYLKNSPPDQLQSRISEVNKKFEDIADAAYAYGHHYGEGHGDLVHDRRINAIKQIRQNTGLHEIHY